MKNNYKYLFKNIGILSLSQFSSKIVSFLLVPMYARTLTTEEYGSFDIVSTMIILIIPILTLNVKESVLRFSLDKRIDISSVLGVAISLYLQGLLILAIGVAMLWWFEITGEWHKYLIYAVFMYALISWYEILSNLARGMEKINVIAWAGVVITLSNAVSNVLALLVLKIGIIGLFYSVIISNGIAILYISYVLKIWRYFIKDTDNSRLKRQMLFYSTPMILTSVSWWINSAVDRYVVLNFCGLSVAGLYSMAFKIPTIISTMQAVFNQAWVLSSVKEYDSEDKNGFFAVTYGVYHSSLILICSISIIATHPLARILFGEEFYDSWIYVPFLIVSVLFGGLIGYIGGILSAVKAAKSLGISVLAGAIINVVLNLVLVYLLGAIGAAISTMIAYFAVWRIRITVIRRYIHFKRNFTQDYLGYIVLFIQVMILLLWNENGFLYLIEFSLFLCVLFLCHNDIKIVLGKLYKLGYDFIRRFEP